MGNLPEFSGSPPVLESAVTLYVPRAGADAELTLDRGRIHLMNHKPSGPAVVRVRFARDTLEITLSKKESELCLDLWNDPPRRDISSVPSSLAINARGEVKCVLQGVTLHLTTGSHAEWTAGLLPKASESAAALPGWWLNGPDRSQPFVQETILALVDWQEKLQQSADVRETILNEIRSSDDSTYRMVGLLFLGSIEKGSHLVEFLEDPARADHSHNRVRSTAIYALQTWLGRKREHATELARDIQARRGYSKERTDLILQLLHLLSAENLREPRTLQTLLGYLDNEFLPIRQLAFWHLALIRPDLADKSGYDPSGPAEQRKSAIAVLKKEMPDGWVPQRAKGPAARNVDQR